VIDLWDLRVGDALELRSGVIASVVLPTEDGQWVPVKYERFERRPEMVGGTDLVSEAEIARGFRSTAN